MSRPMRALPRVLVVSTVVALVVGATGSLAAAHVEADPERIKPGRETTVEFIQEHGCQEKSPTTRMTILVPRRVTDAVAIEKSGWTVTADGQEITFEGGPSPSADKPDRFGLTFTAPRKKGELVFKVVQECQEGVVRWIDTGDDAKYPPAIVGVGKDVGHDEEEDDH